MAEAHIVGTVQIDGVAASRDVIVIKDDHANGRQVVAEGTSAGDGSFDISYNDWTGAVIALALDRYGQAFETEVSLNAGTIVHPTTPNGYVYEVTTAGTTGTEEPAWTTDSSVQSGSVTFNPREFYRPVASGPLQGEVTQEPEPTDPGITIGTMSLNYAHTVLIADDNTVVAFGRDSAGQSTAPAGISTAIAVATQYNTSLAVLGDGTTVAWGLEEAFSESLYPSGETQAVHADGDSYHFLIMRSDGTIASHGYDTDGVVADTPAVSDAIDIATSINHSLVVTSDGTVQAWGNDGSGKATVPAGLSGVISVSAGSDHSVALKSDGTVVCWGSDADGQSSPPSELSDVIAIAAGYEHTLALTSEGLVTGWGANFEGQLDVPSGLSDVVGIAAGDYYSAALKSDGTVLIWGQDGYGETVVPSGFVGLVK